MLIVQVNSKGQITLPLEIRHKLKIKSGDRMLLLLDRKNTSFKLFTKTLLDMRGSVKVNGEQDFDKIRREATKKRATMKTSDEA